MGDISREKINFYMERTAQQLTPANLWWYIRESAGSGLICILTIAVMALSVFFSMYLQSSEWAAVAIVVVLVNGALNVLGGIFRQEPGYWRFYSPHQCYERFPDFYRNLSPVIEEIRATDRMAEFNVAVLEQDRQYFGAVLFQMRDLSLSPNHTDAGSPDIPFKQGEVSKIFTIAGEPLPDSEMLCVADTG